jgi:hypothetical protein
LSAGQQMTTASVSCKEVIEELEKVLPCIWLTAPDAGDSGALTSRLV